MDRKLKILAVCGFGVGTSLILKMNIEKAMGQLGIEAEVENIDITTASGAQADFILTSNELAPLLQDKFEIPVAVVINFMSIAEIKEKCLDCINKLNK